MYYYGSSTNITMIVKVCDRESRRDSRCENRLVLKSGRTNHRLQKRLCRDGDLIVDDQVSLYGFSCHFDNYVWGMVPGGPLVFQAGYHLRKRIFKTHPKQVFFRYENRP